MRPRTRAGRAGVVLASVGALIFVAACALSRDPFDYAWQQGVYLYVARWPAAHWARAGFWLIVAGALAVPARAVWRWILRP